MTYEQIRQAITTRMMAFTGIDADSIELPNDSVRIDPAGKEKWCRLSIQNAEAHMAGMADRPYTRKPGLIVIQCFAREQTGMKALTELADKLEAHFAYWRTGNLECLEASMIPAGTRDGWMQVNVRIPFRAG